MYDELLKCDAMTQIKPPNSVHKVSKTKVLIMQND